MDSHSVETSRSAPAERPASVRYLGFRNTELGRAYSLRVDAAGVPRSITVTIPHAAFTAKQARFQDAPELCFAMLQKALAERTDLPDGLELVVSSEDITDFHDAQLRKIPERKKRARPQEPELR